MLQCWEGNNYSDEIKKILILGESHYSEESDCGLPLKKNETKGVVNYYLDLKTGKESSSGKNNWTSFFSKIASAFGYRYKYEDFYGKILFANYIDKYCGLKTSHAFRFLEDDKYRTHCNDELFELINEKSVDCVFCFSKRVYEKLPSLGNDSEREETIMLSPETLKRNEWVFRCNYKSGQTHNHCTVLLNRDLDVFCFRHPASGFSSARAHEYLKKIGIV